MAFPFERPCSRPGCGSVTRGPAAMCMRACQGFLCPKHRKADSHPCLQVDMEEKEGAVKLLSVRLETDVEDWRRFSSSIDKDYIEAQACALRPNHDCALSLPDPSAIDGLSIEEAGAFVGGQGGMRFYNHHYTLTFDDGLKWVVRCRRLRKDRPSDEVMRMVLDSEIQTMECLREAGVVVPRAYRPPDLLGHPSRRSNDLYFFTDFVDAPEFPLAFLQHQPKPLQKLLDEGRLTEDFISTFIRSYVGEMIKLASRPFEAIGSLYPKEGEAYVGPMIDKFVGSRTKPYFQGPYKTAYERWMSVINFNLDMILSHKGYPGDACLNYLLMLDLRGLVEGMDELKQVEDTFYILAWIDWEWAVVTTKAEAFAAPLAFHGWGISDVLPAWEEKLFEAYLEQGRPDLAVCVKHGRKYHWLEKLANPAGGSLCHPRDYHAYRQYISGQTLTKRAKGQKLEVWIEALKVTYKDDPGYQTLMREGGAVGEAASVGQGGPIARVATGQECQLIVTYVCPTVRPG